MKRHAKKVARTYRIISGVIIAAAFLSALLGASTFDFEQSAYCAGEMELNEMTPPHLITIWMVATIGMFILGIAASCIAAQEERYGSIY